MFYHRRWSAALAGFALLLPAGAAGQTSQGKESKADSPKQVVEAPIVVSGTRYLSGNKPDPFLNPLIVKKKAEQLDEEIPRGTPPPGIAGMFTAQVELRGISIREGVKTAVFRGSDKRAYFLQEGDKLFDGYVKTIDADSVLLIRETRMKSGRVLTQEIVKHLRTP